MAYSLNILHPPYTSLTPKSNKHNRVVRDVFVLVRLRWDQFSPQSRSCANTNINVVRLTIVTDQWLN